jgi:2-C-methyl-D-erythritol 4-phosphate cytidylyltransferase
MSVSVILVAGGAGTRLGAAVAKAMVPLGGRPLLAWSIERLAPLAAPPGELIAVVPAGEGGEQLAEVARGLVAGAVIVPGGARRRDSVLAGLERARSRLVLVHDAARPFVTTDLARRVADAARRHRAAVPAVEVADTVVRADGDILAETLPRRALRAVQTPQAFDRDLLLRAHRRAAPDWDASDDASMVRRLGEPVALVPGDAANFKITWEGDIVRAEAVLARARGEEASR